ncbi:hypothetical protein FDP41_013666 [Naegleria fowleri]|uniref:Uncharacterized protein n=1 Tax=Naegleria fowleri TaxID=5763 RepID=A0A6A5C0Y4_NAEFO|nr:uncharacterized protein FDP41_013666 [Naegleria fowleri]KAF0980452.1 hypothetical protein FDP41_013666 [Naegleria fowleri]
MQPSSPSSSVNTPINNNNNNGGGNSTSQNDEFHDELARDIKEHLMQQQQQQQQSKVEIKRQVSEVEAEKERKNWLIHVLYTRQDIDECLQVIDEQMKACEGRCEFALYVKGLIKRQQGDIAQSLQLFQQACILNPMNPQNIKQVGKSLYLLGKFKEAIEIYDEAKKISPQDWEIYHNKGLCHANLGEFEKAEDCYQRANSIHRHDITFIELGKIFTIQERYEEAIDIYLEALDFSPENPELLSTVGLLYLRIGDNLKAFDYLGNSLSHDPSNPKTILATGSIIQDHGEMDVALSKYRIAAKKNPNSAQLWNNIGMCFFGKLDYVTSIACLKRALYLAPFEWIISYNLGLVHLNTKQYASAFHYFSTSINLNPNFASTYMYLGITLNRLDDFENACSAYEKAIEMESDYLFELNYAITLFNHQQLEQARVHFLEFERLFQEAHSGEEAEECDDEYILEARKKLSALLS